MLYNAFQYSFKDTVSQGHTLWTRGGTTLRVTAFDGMFALTDYVDQLSSESPQFFMMELQDLDALLKIIKDGDGGDYFDLSDMPLSVAEGEFLTLMQQADSLCFPEGWLDPKPIDFVALSPDRLTRLGRLKPKGYPIDCKVFDDGANDPVIAFRYGPTVRGAIAPVNRPTILEMYSGEEVWR